jgi:putative transposase
VYSLHYHLILVTKYRQDTFTPERADFVRQTMENFADNYGVVVKNLEGDRDHVHMLFKAKPTTDLVRFVNTLKGSTARRMEKRVRPRSRTVGRLVLDRLVLPHIDRTGRVRRPDEIRGASARLMHYNYRYRLWPGDLADELRHHIDTCRQLYNHCRYKLGEGDETPARYRLQGTLPDLKQWWGDLNDVHSKVLQMVVKRLYDNLSTLRERKERGHRVGKLRWKPPREYRSLTYNQTGFKLENKSGRARLSLSKIGEVPLTYHREIPDDATIKQVSIKQEPTGEWYAIFGVETGEDAPPKPEEPENTVGIDVGILKYLHDTDGTAVGSLDLSAERSRLEREQRTLSRKEHGSSNWERQRRTVARRHADLKQKRRDFLHKLSNYYATEYDLVAVENLNIAGMMQFSSNSRNRASAAWGTFLRMLDYKCEREGTHFVPVEPRNTTKECSQCGVRTDKPLWVREHSCPACGFQADRDANAAVNVLHRAYEEVGLGQPESTPAETEAAVGAEIPSIPASVVCDTGSPSLKERTAQAVSE